MKLIGIIGAMEVEVASLKEMMTDVTIRTKASMEFNHGCLLYTSHRAGSSEKPYFPGFSENRDRWKAPDALKEEADESCG